YLLPRLQPPHPEMPKKTKRTLAPGSSKSITVHLKSARNPTFEFTVSNVPVSTTTIQDLKDSVRGRVVDGEDNGAVALDKIKILYKRKLVSGTSKTIAEVMCDEPELLTGGKEVLFGVMIMGGAKVVEGALEEEGEASATSDAAAAAAAAATVPKAAVGPSGEALLETEQFWDDLQGFLGQRLKDEDEAKQLSVLFKGAWAASR
ncbi:hypothetical protein ARAM_004426, partial [Aspergillus rambellii]